MNAIFMQMYALSICTRVSVSLFNGCACLIAAGRLLWLGLMSYSSTERSAVIDEINLHRCIL